MHRWNSNRSVVVPLISTLPGLVMMASKVDRSPPACLAVAVQRLTLFAQRYSYSCRLRSLRTSVGAGLSSAGLELGDPWVPPPDDRGCCAFGTGPPVAPARYFCGTSSIELTMCHSPASSL